MKKSSAFATISMILVITGLLSLPKEITASLITTPRDTEALNGNLTFFNCSSNSSTSDLQWFHYKIGTDKNRQIVYGYGKFYGSFGNRSRIEGNDTTGVSNLVIERVSMEDAGKFECQEDLGRGASGFAELSVLETNHVCEWKIENRQEIGSGGDSTKKLLFLKCTVAFRGNQPPEMIWRRSGSNEAITQGVKQIDDSATRVTYTLEESYDSDGQSFQCETTKSATTQFSCSSAPSDSTYGTVIMIIIAASVIGVVFLTVIVVVVITLCKRRRQGSASTKISCQSQIEKGRKKISGGERQRNQNHPPKKEIEKRGIPYDAARSKFENGGTDFPANEEHEEGQSLGPTESAHPNDVHLFESAGTDTEAAGLSLLNKIESEEEKEQPNQELEPLIASQNGSQLDNQTIRDEKIAEEENINHSFGDNESAIQSVSERMSPDKDVVGHNYVNTE